MKIAIIGCGWLGLPLAKELLKNDHFIYGSTTSINKFEELKVASIQPFLYDGFENKKITIPANEIDCLIISFPPSKSFDYPVQIEQLIQQFPVTCKIIFTSSTSVYQDVEGEIDELGSVKINHPVFLAEEKLNQSNRSVTILRLAGLIGDKRHPILFLSGKNIDHGNLVVNLVHQLDVIAAVRCLIEKQIWKKTYNLCYNEHPKKGDYYLGKATEFGLLPPSVQFSKLIGKSIDGNLIERELGFQYAHRI